MGKYSKENLRELKRLSVQPFANSIYCLFLMGALMNYSKSKKLPRKLKKVLKRKVALKRYKHIKKLKKLQERARNNGK